jgi:hypothetical protein
MASEKILQIQKQLENHEKRLSELETLLRAKPKVGGKAVAIKEFILAKRPKNDVQRALAIGYYLEKYQGLSSFNVRDLEDGFRAAKEKVPQNVPDKVQINVRKGHMMEAKEKKDGLKAYVLTNTGEKYVENDFKKGE